MPKHHSIFGNRICKSILESLEVKAVVKEHRILFAVTRKLQTCTFVLGN